MPGRVLVVDDATFMRAMIKDILTANGYEVVGEATNGAEALARYEELRPDLVTMDITMPEMDGVTAVKQLMSRFPDARVIMVSAMGQQALVVDAIQAGAKDFVVKPFDVNRFLEAVRRAMG